MHSHKLNQLSTKGVENLATCMVYSIYEYLSIEMMRGRVPRNALHRLDRAYECVVEVLSMFFYATSGCMTSDRSIARSIKEQILIFSGPSAK
jgi:hypothetical protein